PISKVLYYCFIVGGSYIVCPMLYGRVLSAKSEKVARHGVHIAAVALAICAFLITFIGFYAHGLIPENTPADNVLTTLLSVAMPSWLAMFIDLFLLCAVVSSADSCLFAASSALSRSLLKTDNIKTNRWCSVILIMLAL